MAAEAPGKEGFVLSGARVEFDTERRVVLDTRARVGAKGVLGEVVVEVAVGVVGGLVVVPRVGSVFQGRVVAVLPLAEGIVLR